MATKKKKLKPKSNINWYWTHYPILAEIIEEFKPEQALEFGCGLCSTKLLVDKCLYTISIEMQNKEWYDKTYKEVLLPISNNVAHSLNSKLGTTNRSGWLLLNTSPDETGEKAIESLKTLYRQPKPDIVLVDGAAGSRTRCIEASVELTDTIIIHDTEEKEFYNWDELKLNGGWAWIDIPIYQIWTSVYTRSKLVKLFLQNKILPKLNQLREKYKGVVEYE